MYKVGGFSELLPEYKILEEQMLNIIKENYKKYGFTPIETPVMEKTEILTAKGGGEIKNQIFGVYGLAQGKEDLKDYSLRYDLTVPLSRYVLDYRGEITFPFKSSHIGKVWRGESQQRGRNKEFYQTDIDVIWDESIKFESEKNISKNLFYDAEVLFIACDTFKKIFKNFFLNTQIKINLNNRKIVSGFIESLGLKNKSVEISTIIDKIDKIEEKEFKKELFLIIDSNEKVDKILQFCRYNVNYENILDIGKTLKIENEEFNSGINDLNEVLKYLKILGLDENIIKINFSIIRGLAYYTGTVFETFIDGDRKLGSIGSGGRYEKLTSYIDPKTNFSGVGFSIGITRLEYYLFENIKIEDLQKTTSDYLIINFGESTLKESLGLYKKLSLEGKSVEFYPEPEKLSKQFKYADKKKIKYSVILGTTELEKGIYILKNMKTGESLRQCKKVCK